MLGSDVLPEFDDCEALKGFRFRDDGGVSSTSEGDVLLRLLEPSSDGELGQKGSKRFGGGEESGDELNGTAMLESRLLRKTDGGISESSGGGEDSGEVISCCTERGIRLGFGVLNARLEDSTVIDVSSITGEGSEGSVATVTSVRIVSTLTYTSISLPSLVASSLGSGDDSLRRFGGGPASQSSVSLFSSLVSPLSSGVSSRGWRAAASNWAWMRE
jgi:hypothetical protein